MRRASAALLALAAAAACAPPAHAQFVAVSQDFALLGDDARLIRETQGTATISGDVVVEFHSRERDCAAVGRCGLEGTIRWRPPSRASWYMDELLVGGKRRTEVSLRTSAPFAASPQVVTRVRRTTADGTRLCADASEADGSISGDGDIRTVRLSLVPAGADLLGSVCTAPVQADVTKLLRRGSEVPVDALRHGTPFVSLATERPIDVPGLVGVVRSRVLVFFNRGRVVRDPDAGSALQVRLRTLQSPLRVVRVTGGVDVSATASAAPETCAPVDACGVTTTLALRPRSERGSGSLFTIARARTPRARLRAALGLQPGHGSLLKAFGGIEWSGDGTLAATSSRGDGGPPCTDAGALEAGAINFSPGTGTAIDASLVLASAPAAGAVDTRCPAPALGPGQPLAATTLSRRAFGKRRIVLRFRAPRSFATDGYAVRSSPSVTVVLVRGRPLLQRG